MPTTTPLSVSPSLHFISSPVFQHKLSFSRDTMDTGSSKQQQQQQQQQSPASPPPSSSSSPSHEFSFTISLHSSSTPVSADQTSTKTTPPSFAIDLSPADDIFFHGHLLPLHLLSHLPLSPRSSTNSLDSFTLPITDSIDHQKTHLHQNCSTSTVNNSHGKSKSKSTHIQSTYSNNENTKESRTKSKSFSLFGLTRRKKEFEDRERDENKENKLKKGLIFDVSHVVKKYMRMVRPLLFRGGHGRRESLHFHGQPYSFSGNVSNRNKQELRGRRGEFSAPVSIRTSPTNSGPLLSTATLPSSSSTSNSTMDELQAAIQAAIAHCKNSIAVEDKLTY